MATKTADPKLPERIATLEQAITGPNGLVDLINELKKQLSESYVRKDVYAQDQKAIADQFLAIEQERTEAKRQQMVREAGKIMLTATVTFLVLFFLQAVGRI